MKKRAMVSVHIKAKALPSSPNKNTLYRLRLGELNEKSINATDVTSATANKKGDDGCVGSIKKEKRSTIKVAESPIKNSYQNANYRNFLKRLAEFD
ncbi:hypothetical protein [uncultured Campylobacter sp.]|uniref:hypothetical protein n=1 Tax=uncultured Campylobacter sp. TaxID=218934 RepID=UPI002603DF5C|nr:hypothetical protein [uncultured Campylobacter sp.]